MMRLGRNTPVRSSTSAIFWRRRQTKFFSNLLVACLRRSIKKSEFSYPSFPRRRESRLLKISWIPARASYRQLGRNDVTNYVTNFRGTILFAVIVLGLTTGCDRLPGKPTPEERWKPATEVTDFSQLYARNCSGCHGADGRLGAARPLNDPLYLALVSVATLRAMIAQGVPGTSAPALAQQVGGPLTDKQIDILVEGMRSRWGKAENFNNVAFPPYSLQDASAKGSAPGDSQRGAVVYQTYCAQCHGKDGSGGPKGGSVINPDYLALISDQALRTTVIVGRSDLGMPDWRANTPGRPMSPQQISDVVEWLASHRQAGLLAQGKQNKERK